MLRRKTLANSLAAALPFDKAAIQAALSDCGLSADIRGERLTLRDFAGLAARLGRL